MSAVRKPKGVPAKFAANPHRRAMLAKIHIAKKDLQLSQDDYEAVLLRVAGVASAAECNDRQLDEVLKDFERRGFSSKARSSGPKPADHPVALKARAMWISLYHLGAIHNSSDTALEAFARRQLQVERLQWANQAQGYKLIEALKAIAERHGWSQSLEDVRPVAAPVVLKRRLVEALLGKLWEAGLVPATWDVSRAARELAGLDLESLLFASASELEGVAKAFGATLRDPAARLAEGAN